MVKDIQENISDRAVPLYLPIGKELEFKGLVNVLTGKSYMYKGDGSKEVTEGDILADMADAVAAARETFVERAVEADDELMMRYLEEKRSSGGASGSPSQGRLCKIGLSHNPGLGTGNIGVYQLMDMVVNYMPSPKDMLNRAALKWRRGRQDSPDEKGPFLGSVFKVMVDPYVGKLSFVKVFFSGTLTSDQTVFNVTEGEEERTIPSAS